MSTPVLLKEELSAFIERHREGWEVPGCAVAAVKGDEVVLNQGFGMRGLETGLPTTAKTQFPIGSATKPFTAAAVGAMVTDGLIDWETPVREYMPDFRVHDPVATERITPLDLLSHRSGLSRHEFVWLAHPDRSRDDLVSRLRFLPSSKDLRAQFQYCNLGYVTVGHLIKVVTGQTWEEYVSTRLLKPLGMDRTNFRVSDMLSSDDFAKGHERRGESIVETPYRVFDATGPAGSINSCTNDMQAWLKVSLSGGTANGEEIISPAIMRAMQSPQMVFDAGGDFPEVSIFAYGLGWMIGDYRGHRVLEHGGGIDGFLTHLMLIPEMQAGLVVLTNCISAGSLFGSFGQVVAYRVLDSLLGLEPIDWQERISKLREQEAKGKEEAKAVDQRKTAPLLRPLEEYTGDYIHPGYGTFSIALEDGKLLPRFGSMIIDLEHRYFDVFDLKWREFVDQDISFPLIFETGYDGVVAALSIPFEPEVDPIRFTRQNHARNNGSGEAPVPEE